MKKIKIIFSILLFFISTFSFAKILLQTNKEHILSKNSEYIFRWWDLIEVKKQDELCSSNQFYGLRFLKITCKDFKIAKWIREQKGYQNIDYFAVIPAQALFYKLRDFEHEKLQYLTITWNDFSNREKALRSINRIFDSISEDCVGENRIVFVLIPTSNETIEGSKINFQDKKNTIFSQSIIEDKLINFKNKCIKRKIMRDQENKVPIAYWIEFKTSFSSDKILLKR